ncbi:hypothetical protein LTR86_006945 [Recurvomyces mirabilis]|nr:hypothetical protein LTR86_006945 [Recurvomyces mirabilis]
MLSRDYLLPAALALSHLTSAAPTWPGKPGNGPPSSGGPPGGHPGYGPGPHGPPNGGPPGYNPHPNPSQPPGQPITNLVDLGYSQYEGYSAQGVNQWLGMRFAAPPVGDLRWRAPQSPPQNTSSGVLSAKNFGATCIGYWIYTQETDSINEDCLYLDVFAPQNATTESKLPVWFFIQGGGYAADSDQNFNLTQAIVQSNYSMVFVAINYRVGAFGWLSSEKVREDGDLNVGLLDQRFALEWTQKYIHLFGGDPEHVVIHGDSAGAGSVAFQMAAYGGRDDHLFVGGIAESPFWPTHRTVSEMEFQFDRFAANVSCSADQAKNGDIMACLRSKDSATLQSADIPETFPGGDNGTAEWYFLPVVDGNFSQDLLYNQFEQGRIIHVPIMVGDDTDEGTGFVPNATNSTTMLQFFKNNFPLLSDDQLQQINETYPEDIHAPFPKHAAYFPATELAYGENTLICPGIEMSDSLSTYLSGDQVWNYRYNVEDAPTVAAGLGVPHVSEKKAIYGVNNTNPNDLCDYPCSYDTYNAPVIPVVMDYWISFILSLNPNTYKAPNAPVWEPWTGNGGQKQRLVFETGDVGTGMEVVPADQLARCEFWKGLANMTQQ